MAKMVGFACNIKPLWMDKAAQLLEEKLPEDKYKEKLREFISFEIDGEVRLRKTCDILMRIWYKPSESNENLRKEALMLLGKYPEYNKVIYLCMIYLNYPVVADVCKFMGKLFEFKDEITNAILNQKLYDEWGERETLKTVCRRITLTLKDMGFLSNESRLRYKLYKQVITKPEVVNFLLAVAMTIDGDSYYTFANLNDFYTLFPFEFQICKEQLMSDAKFSLNTYDGQLCVTMNEKF